LIRRRREGIYAVSGGLEVWPRPAFILIIVPRTAGRVERFQRKYGRQVQKADAGKAGKPSQP
jgi:hypothetical protein